MKYLNWLRNNLNVISLVAGICLVVNGDPENGFELIKRGFD